MLTDFLARERLSVSRIRIWFSAFRLSILMEGLPETPSEQKVEVRGPRASVAYDLNRQLTPAATGFANAQGVEPSALILRTVDGEEFLFARKTEKGKLLAETLAPLWEKTLRTIPWNCEPWAEGMLLPQPPAWFCALIDDRLPGLSVDGLKASRETAFREGNAWKRHSLPQAAAFPQLMNELEIHSLPGDRLRFLESQFTLIVDSGASVRKDSVRLERVCFEQERPRAFSLPLPAEAFQLPQPLLTHLFDETPAFVPIESGKGGFLPKVIGFADQKPPDDGEIRKRADHLEERIREASLIWMEELKRPLSERVGELRQIPSSTGAGTLYEDALKISRIAHLLARKLTPQVTDDLLDRYLLFRALERATAIYKRFPSLEGEIIPMLVEHQGLEPELVKIFKERPWTTQESPKEPFSPAALALHLARFYQQAMLSDKGTQAEREAAADRFLAALGDIPLPIDLFPLDASDTSEAQAATVTELHFWREAVSRKLLALGIEKKKFEWLLTPDTLSPVALFVAAKRWSDGPPKEMEFFSAIHQRIKALIGDRIVSTLETFSPDTPEGHVSQCLEKMESGQAPDPVSLFECLVSIRAELEASLMNLPPVLDEHDPAQAKKLSLLRRISLQLALLPLPGLSGSSKRPIANEAGAA